LERNSDDGAGHGENGADLSSVSGSPAARSSARLGSTENIRLAQSNGSNVSSSSADPAEDEEEPGVMTDDDALEQALRIIVGTSREAEQVQYNFAGLGDSTSRLFSIGQFYQMTSVVIAILFVLNSTIFIII
jgi:hypothetical protein